MHVSRLQCGSSLPAFCLVLAVPLCWVWSPSEKQEVSLTHVKTLHVTDFG